MKQINYNDIKTPKTVEEFRENLKKYFICTGSDWSERNALYTQGAEIKINELNSLSDLYNRKEIPMHMLGTPKIAPYVDFDMDTIKTEETMSMMWSRNFEEVMKDESRFKICDIVSNETHSEFMSNAKVMWIGIDNQIYREFFIKTLGDYSGYISNKEIEEVA